MVYLASWLPIRILCCPPVRRIGEMRPVKGCLGRAWLVLHGSPAKHGPDSPPPPRARLPDTRSGRRGGEGGAAWEGGEPRGSGGSGGHREKTQPRKLQQMQGTGWTEEGGGPLRVHVRPQTPEQHRRTPSLRKGDAEERRGRGRKKKKKAEPCREGREAERGRD